MCSISVALRQVRGNPLRLFPQRTTSWRTFGRPGGEYKECVYTLEYFYQFPAICTQFPRDENAGTGDKKNIKMSEAKRGCDKNKKPQILVKFPVVSAAWGMPQGFLLSNIYRLENTQGLLAHIFKLRKWRG